MSLAKLNRIMDDLHTIGLVGTPPRLLLHLANNPRAGATVRGAAEALKTSKPSVSRAMDFLQGKGLAIRSEDQNDRRSVDMKLTDTGKAQVTKLVKLV